MSRLLLENSNNKQESGSKRKAEEPVPEQNADQSHFKGLTP